VANPLPITLHASGTESASGTGTAVDIDTLRTALQMRLIVAEIDADAEFVVHVETSADETTWRAMGSFVAYGPGVTRVGLASADRYVRARWQLASGKSATFVFSGDAHVVYADPDDLATTGVRPEAIEDVDETIKVHSLIMASADMDAALKTRFHMPLSAWGEDVRGRTAARAVYYIFKHRGFDPSGADAVIILDGGHVLENGMPSAVERWLTGVAKGQVHPVGVVDSTPTKREFGARVRSKPRRDVCQ
jgi:phage gp36-like protein